MPSRRRPSPVLDDNRVDEPPKDAGRAADVADALTLADEAEAEAIAAAARARARAIRLRRQAEAVQAEPDGAAEPATAEVTDSETDTATVPDEGSAVDESDGDVAEAPTQEPARSRRRWLPRPRWKPIAIGAAIISICALLAASGYMVWNHRQVVREQQNQSTTSKENPDGAFVASSVKVGMKKVDGAWPISAFDPV